MTATSEQQEIEAIRRVVAEIERVQRNELVEEFIGLFREDAVWTTGHGKVLIGRDAIAEFTRKVLPGATAGSIATYEVVHVLFVRPDVAAVKVRQRYLTLEGQPVPGDGEGAPLYVMTKEDGHWRLTACQNTVVVG
ncbi:SgcJ/EcaC family oxidoreductase [Allokutzneria multivorans]|uniref:SgcJ/EcaC family oxidoreductase n=1 Tax=Allokutzneria multivorans TaxID=1142134 RepID=A0ABP7TRN9_9PSEU